MKNVMILLTMLVNLGVYGQDSPVTFDFYTEGDTLIIEGTIAAGWHVYATNLPSDEGPLATEVIFTPSNTYKLKSPLLVASPHTAYDETFEMELSYYDNTLTFKQVIEKTTTDRITVEGIITYMVCNDQTCLPPTDVPMIFTSNK